MPTSTRKTTARAPRDDVARLELLRSAHPRSRIFVRLADAYLAAGDARRALEVAREGLLEHPADAGGHAALSRALDTLGFFDQAAHAAHRAAELADPAGATPAHAAEAPDLERERAPAPRGAVEDSGADSAMPPDAAPSVPPPRNPRQDLRESAPQLYRKVAAATPEHTEQRRRVARPARRPQGSDAPPGTSTALAPATERGPAGTLDLRRRPRAEEPPARPAPPERIGELEAKPAAATPQDAAPANAVAAPLRAEPAEPEPLLHGAGLELAELLVELLEAGDGGGGPVRLRRRLAAAVAGELGLTPSRVQAVVLAALVQELDPAGKAGARLRRIGLPPETLRAVRERSAPWAGGARRPAAEARILAVVNPFTAALPPRSAGAGVAVPEAVEQVVAEAGSRLDPVVVYALARVVRGGAASGPAHERPPLLLLGEDPVRCGKLMAHLALLGHRVATAADPERALARLAVEPAAAVVVGPARPHAAEALIRRLRRDAAVGGIPILAAGYDDPSMRAALLDAGADACVPERAPAAELRATLAALLRRAGSSDEEPAAPRAAGNDGAAATGVADPWFPERGLLDDFRPPWLCRVLEHAGCEATLRLESADDLGLVAVAAGRVCHAATLGRRGPAALRELMGWTAGSFCIVPGAGTERTIDGGLAAALAGTART
jgi:hypothetical protein